MNTQEQFYNLGQWGHHIPGPLESPIEDTFAESALKYFRPEGEMAKQVEYTTSLGRFRVDFVLRLGDQLIGIECDGDKRHSFKRDLWRDAGLVTEKCVSIVYHLSGAGIHYHLEDCIYIMSLWDPEIFSERGRQAIARVCDETVITQMEEHKESVDYCNRLDGSHSRYSWRRYAQTQYCLSEDEDIWADIWTFRRALTDNPELRNYHDFGVSHPELSLDELDTLYEQERNR